MPRNFNAMTTLVTTKLQSAGTMDYSVAEVTYQIEESLKEFAFYKPHIVEIPFSIESRYGVDSAGSASALSDSVKYQFLSTDAANEKVVHNTYDHTWAVVKASTSTSVLNLSADIMATGENYRIYNKRCSNEKQVYIGNVLPVVMDVESVEYPIGQKRNWEIVSQGVLEIDVDYVADSDASSSKTQLPNTTVLVRFKRPHILSEMADLSGLVAGTSGAKAATTFSCSGVTASSTIQSGQEFYIADHRQSYVITTDATASTAGIASISFYPPLEAVADSASVVTFTNSTLKPHEEEMFADLVSARLAISKPVKMYSQANSAIATVAAATASIAAMTTQLNAATTAIASGTTELAKTVALIASAGTAVALVNDQVNLASTAIAAGTVLINTITVDDTPQTDWLNSASGYLSVAGGLLSEANGYFNQAKNDASVFTHYRDLAIADLNVSTQYMNQAIADLKQVSSQLSIANAGRNLEAWGQNKLAETLNRLRRDTKPRKSVRFPTE